MASIHPCLPPTPSDPLRPRAFVGTGAEGLKKEIPAKGRFKCRGASSAGRIAPFPRRAPQAGRFALIVGMAACLAVEAAAEDPVGGNLIGAGLRTSLARLAEIDEDARKAFDRSDPATSRAVLQSGDSVLVAYETGDGDIVSRRFADGSWSRPVPVTAGAPRRDGERWDMPTLVAGPDDCVWIAYRSEVRRRVFLHRWLGESWGARMDGRGIFRVRPEASGTFDEELRPITGFVVEGSRVRDAIELRLTSSDDPPVDRIESIPMLALEAAPGEGSIFIDTRDVFRASGLVWQVEMPAKHPGNPLLSPPENPDAPDAVRVFNRGTVLRENGRFRMWYSATGTDSPVTPGQPARSWQSYMRVCYAESEDGIQWRRPELGLVEFKGSRSNNVLPGIQRLPTIVHDLHEPDPDRRYKCFGNAAPIRREEGHLMTSADGLSWRVEPSPRLYPGTRPYYASEFQSVFRDEREADPARLWKAYGLFATGPRRRAAQLSISPDGIHWTGYPENPVVDPLQGVSHCIHDLLVWPEQGRYVGLLQTGDALHNYEWELVTSRDGVHFSRVSDGRPFLARGAEDQWDHGGIQAAVPVRVGDEAWFYYGAREKPWSAYPADPEEIWKFKSHCGLATIRAGRYAGFRLADPSEPGILVTQPIHCEFDRELALVVNASADGQSPIRVAVVDAASGEPVEGYASEECRAIEGDGVAQPVAWSGAGRVRLDRERPVRLRFELEGRQSRLYGFAWRQP